MDSLFGNYREHVENAQFLRLKKTKEKNDCQYSILYSIDRQKKYLTYFTTIIIVCQIRWRQRLLLRVKIQNCLFYLLQIKNHLYKAIDVFILSINFLFEMMYFFVIHHASYITFKNINNS